MLSGDTLAQIRDLLRGEGIPATATPFVGTNQTALTTTTAVDVQAAVTGKKKWITSIKAVSLTASENAHILIRDNDSTPKVLATIAVTPATNNEFKFPVPIEVGAGFKIQAITTTATVGDTYVTVEGYEEA